MRDPAPRQTPAPQQAPARPGMPETQPFGAGEPGYSLLDLQRAVGNQALQRLLRQPAAGPAPGQGGGRRAVGPSPVQRRVSPRLLQRTPDPAAGDGGDGGDDGGGGVSFKYSVTIDRVLTSDELLLAFVRQYHNLATEAEAKAVLAREKWNWTSTPPAVTAKHAGQRYVLIRVRDYGITPGTAAEQKERKEYLKGLSPADQAAINAETDSQFWEKTRYRVGKQLGHSADDKEMAQYWKVLRDELVRKRQAIAALPPEIQKFLFDESAAPAVAPKDFEAVLRIAAKIAALTPAELAEYRSRVTAKTADWGVYEAAVDRFLAERREREATAQERRALETRLYNLEALYDRYRSYLSMSKNSAMLAASGTPQGLGTALGSHSALNDMRSKLEADLITAGFPGGIADFEQVIRDYEKLFERETLAVARVMLDQYEHVLWVQEQRYQDPSETQALHQAVTQTSARADYEQGEKIRSEHASAVVMSMEEMQDQAYWSGQRKEAMTRGDTQVGTAAASAGHPLVGNRDFDREKLARSSSESETRALLLGYIAARRKDVADTRQNLKDRPRMIYGLDTLLEASRQAQNIQGGTIYGKIVQDHIADVNWQEAVPQIVLAVISVAAGLLTGGGGTVAVLAAGTALGIGAYQAVEEFRRYEAKSAAYGAGLTADDPTMAWVIVAVIGAGFDAAALASALPKLRPALQAFNAGNEANDVVKLADKLDKLTDVQAGIRQSVLRAADAEAEARAAWKALFRPPAVLRMVIVPGAEEFGRLVYAVYLTVKRGIREFQVFVKTNEAIDLIGDIAKIAPEDLAKLKGGYLQAVAEIEAVAAHGKALGMADNELRAFMNLRGNTRNMTVDQLKAQMDAWKTAKESGVPFAFKSAEQFEDFRKVAASELKKALKKTDPKAEAFLQGSSVSGVSYKRHLPFDEASDLDVAVSSKYLMGRAEKDLGLAVSKSPRRIGPLNEEQIADLGLKQFVKRLGEMVSEPAAAGAAAKPSRKVNVMLFDNEAAVRKPIGEASTETERAAVPLKGK